MKFILPQAMNGQRGRLGKHYSCFYLGARWVWYVNATFRPLYPRGKKPDMRSTGGYVGARAALDWCGKISPPTRIRSPTIQTAASRYTDYGFIRLTWERQHTTAKYKMYNFQSKHNKIYCIMVYNMFHNYMLRPFSLGHFQIVYTRSWQ